MATIKARKQADGSMRYPAVVRLRKRTIVIHQEAKTFSHRTPAEKWAKSREVALEDPGALMRAQHGEKLLRELIRWYIETFATVSKWQRTKQAQLEFLEKHPVGKSNALALTAAMLIDHVRSRRAAGAGPATVGNDLTWIGVVLRAAKSVQEIPVRPEIVDEARTACRELRLIAKSKRRERRPTPSELSKLDEYFSRRDARARIPMRDVLWFAIHSARREAEICRLQWTDNDIKARTGLVRDAKHPIAKEGNHRRFKYTPEAWDIVQRQPTGNEYIFPYDPKSVGNAFTKACRLLGIEDLRFHDLRHEATSRLFERGYQIHEVAQFTLHESWNELKRYTHLRPDRVREIPDNSTKAKIPTEHHTRKKGMRLPSGLLTLPIDQLCKVSRTHQPWGLLAAQSEYSARQQLRKCIPSGLVVAQTEVLRRDPLEWNVGFTKLGQQTKKRAIHDPLTGMLMRSLAFKRSCALMFPQFERCISDN